MTQSSAIPFLCNFVSETRDLSVDGSTDLRKFLSQKKILSKKYYTQDQVLILTRMNDFEADLIGISLLREGIDYVRLNVEDIPNFVRVGCSISSDGQDNMILEIGGFRLDPTKISVALLRYCELSSLDFGSDSLIYTYSIQQWQNIFKGLENNLNCNWINSPISTSSSEDRFKQLSTAKQSGFSIPRTTITNDPSLAVDFYNMHQGNIVIKVLHHHRVDVQNKGFSIYTRRVSDSDLQKFQSLIAAPCILQENVNKKYELRVTVVGDSVFTARLDVIGNTMVDLHSYSLKHVSKKAVVLPEDIQERCRKLVSTLGLRYAALDFVVDHAENIFFLEANPTGDWYWIEHDTGLPITKSMVGLIMECRNDYMRG